MSFDITAAVFVPFCGTALGAAIALLFRKRFPDRLNRVCGGFAAGVMTAASVWSLLLPAIEQAAGNPGMAAVLGGFLAGTALLIATETAVTALYRQRERGEFSGAAFMILAVTLHNVPEGLAVGVACAGYAADDGALTAAGLTALSLGIALQNIPEGAIISLPLLANGAGRIRAFFCGAASGAVEPVAALIALAAASPVRRLMPFFLSAAAGAMLYVTAQELLPEASAPGSRTGSLSFLAGFALMMAMDVLL